MMNYQDELLCDSDDLVCTPKCLEALASNTLLNARARQYCLLLTRGDSVSLKVSQQLGTKVDLNQLVEEGYIASASLSDKSADKPIFSTDPITSLTPSSNTDCISQSSSMPFSRKNKTLSIDATGPIEPQVIAEVIDNDSSISPSLRFASGVF